MMTRYIIKLSILFIFFINNVNAQLIPKQFSFNGTTVGYMVYLPDGYDAKYVYPTIFFYHGVGEMGNGLTDLSKVALNGLPKMIQNGTFPKSFKVNGKTFKFIVVCPQLNGAVPWQTWMDMEYSLIDEVKKNYSVDNSRIYLTGLSQGGGITWQIPGSAGTKASQFAAIAPVCGAMDPLWGYPENIANNKIPVWAFHGLSDNTVSSELTKTWVQKINATAGKELAKITLYPNTDHNSWDKAYDLTYNQTNGYSTMNVFEWLLTNQRGSTPANAQYETQTTVASTTTATSVTTPVTTVSNTTSSSAITTTNNVSTYKSPTANDAVKVYAGDYSYGFNMGYFGNNWQDTDLANLVKNVGGNSIRPSLPESFLRQWGYEIRLNAFKDYAEKFQMKDLTAFVGGPSEVVRDKTKYNGSTNESKVFANIYEPIWNADGTVNTKNYYADYIYKTVKTYGQYVRFWEVWNEPDLTSADPAAWSTRDPYPSELPNLNAPIQHYIRMLRITYEIVKKYDPDDYVTTGGLGYTSFLEAIMRNSDNPDGGKVTADYPNKGGAYFDVLSYHCYPYYYLRSWNNSINNFNFTRNSDAAANQISIEKSKYETILKKYGYGSTYPSKYFIVTESNVSRKTFDWYSTSDEMQRNYNMKVVVQNQKTDIKQMYMFTVGECADYSTATNEYDLMGMYENLRIAKPGTEKMTSSGVGHRTIAQLLLGAKYDASLTTSLKLTDAVDGGVFTKGSEKYYVLWAKTKTDQSENATATFTFPDALSVKTLKQYTWDYSATKKTTDISGNKVSLTGAPTVLMISATADLIANNPVTQTPVTTTPVTTTPVTTTPVTTTPATTTPVTTTPVTTIPVTTTPVTTIPITTKPATTTPVVNTPVTTTPVTTAPVTTTPVVNTPVTTPVTTAPVITTPVITTPVTTTPVITTPVTTKPATTTPVTTTPVINTPVTTTPVTAAPVTTTPVTTTPVTTKPVTTTPITTTPVNTTPVTVITPAKTEASIQKESAKIFPNPVNTEANFSITNQETGKGTISIYNMRGLKVQETAFSKTDTTKNFSVPAANFRTGMYIVVIKVNTKTTVLKMVKI